MKNKYKLITFGLSWDKCFVVGANKDKEKKDMPGPTAYDTRTSLINKRTFTLKGRTKIKIKEELPLGPGEYKIKSLFGKDNCLFLSNIKYCGSTKIVPVSQS